MDREVLWRPSESRIKSSHLFYFKRHIERQFDQSFNEYKDLHKWSVQKPDQFWPELFDFFEVTYTGSLQEVCCDLGFDSYDWFPSVYLNFAENLLKHGHEKSIALTSFHESGKKQELTYRQLREQTRVFQKALGPYLKAGDVLGAYMPNINETVISMLGCTSLGGVFTSTSCDFGVSGVLDRFGQSRPKVIVAASGYEYNGKYFDLTQKLKEIEDSLDTLELLIVVDFLGQGVDLEGFSKAILWEDFLDQGAKDTSSLEFVSRSFRDPLYIMYSSGTTGKPKCIVHSIGGTLLQHIKELGLHTDLKREHSILYFTTCGWMMWNWLVSSLYFGANVCLYEGSPARGGIDKFMNLIDEQKINIFGTSPKFLRALEDFNYKATNQSYEAFKGLETILSTGAPLLPEQFDYVYSSIKDNVSLISICGGTDIIGCFMLGCPIRPIYRGEIQCLGLGMDVACFDESSQAVYEKEGELVCRKSFPSRPIYFLDDPKGEKIHKAYFSTYPNVWHHGDFITLTEDESVIVFGRSDATLNPGGVRIGTAEIYRQTETLDYVEDALCVGQNNSQGDVDILLFLKLKNSEQLNEQRIDNIKQSIRKNTTPRHVPKHIYRIKDIPYTRSGKKMEMAVSRIVNKKNLNNLEAVANPDSLEEYKQFSN